MRRSLCVRVCACIVKSAPFEECKMKRNRTNILYPWHGIRTSVAIYSNATTYHSILYTNTFICVRFGMKIQDPWISCNKIVVICRHKLCDFRKFILPCSSVHWYLMWVWCARVWKTERFVCLHYTLMTESEVQCRVNLPDFLLFAIYIYYYVLFFRVDRKLFLVLDFHLKVQHQYQAHTCTHITCTGWAVCMRLHFFMASYSYVQSEMRRYRRIYICQWKSQVVFIWRL